MSTRLRTISRECVGAGWTLFSGSQARYRVAPAPPGSGVRFRRADHPNSPAFGATIARLDRRPPHPAFANLPARCTTISSDGHAVATVEHLLAVLFALNIRATVELAGAEVPIHDGSGEPFVRRLLDARPTDPDEDAEPITLTEEISVTSRDGASRITASPRDTPGWSVRYELDYGPGAPVPAQSAEWDGRAGSFIEQIAPARTFCLREEAEQMRALGLFSRFSPGDLLVIGPHGPIDNEYRFENEPARHKLLDVVGDLALCGAPIQGDIVAVRSGHALNHQLAAMLTKRATEAARGP